MPTTVKFGTVDATAVNVVSPTEVVATLPEAAAAGTVDVTVTTSGGTDTAAGLFEYVDEPQLNVIVPEGGGDIAVVAGEPTIYVTVLQNFGTTATNVTDTVRLHSDGGDLTTDLIVLESEIGGGGGWVVETPTVEDGDLVLSDVLATIPYQDNRGRMRITVDPSVTDLTGTSTLTDDGGTVLATTSYTYAISGGA